MSNQQENKICQNCKIQFTIEPEDFDFYKKISVPPPTFCSECRLVRRLMGRMGVGLFHQICDLCKTKVISAHAPQGPYKRIYCLPCYYSDGWDPFSYGRDYDFSRTFFDQLRDLLNEMPHAATQTHYTTTVNSPFTNQVDHIKNCYLIFNSAYNEGCNYCHSINRSKESADSMYLDGCELVYQCFRTQKSYRSAYLSYCRDCTDSFFLFDCVNCQNCIGCFGLRNKQYYIFNTVYTKEGYLEKVRQMNLGSYSGLEALRSQALPFLLGAPRRFSYQRLTKDVSGADIYETRNCKNCFTVTGVENGKYIQFMETAPVKDVMDYSIWGDKAELMYESLACGDGVSRFKFSKNSVQSRDLSYCDDCESSSDLFGCVGLRKKQYCILNKQYTKEEYEALIPKIIAHMNSMPFVDKKGNVYGYGEFFPPELLPFAYNETVAQEYFPLTKEQVLKQGYIWRDPEGRDYTITISSDVLPDHIKDAPDSIPQEVIGCAHEEACNHQCTKAFKIIPEELRFYTKMNLPLPRFCPNCRYWERLTQRNPLKLWKRVCMKPGCPNEFETSYSPDRKEIVYCESCYQAEVV